MSCFPGMIEKVKARYEWQINNLGEVVVFLMDEYGKPVSFAICKSGSEMTAQLLLNSTEYIAVKRFTDATSLFGWDYQSWEDVLLVLTEKKTGTVKYQRVYARYTCLAELNYPMPIMRKYVDGKWRFSLEYQKDKLQKDE